VTGDRLARSWTRLCRFNAKLCRVCPQGVRFRARKGALSGPFRTRCCGGFSQLEIALGESIEPALYAIRHLGELFQFAICFHTVTEFRVELGKGVEHLRAGLRSAIKSLE
jgi:hypothetical protein